MNNAIRFFIFSRLSALSTSWSAFDIKLTAVWHIDSQSSSTYVELLIPNSFKRLIRIYKERVDYINRGSQLRDPFHSRPFHNRKTNYLFKEIV